MTSSTSSRQAWPVVAFGFLALALAFSARAALGLVMPVGQSEFGWSGSFISGVGATALIVMAMVAPFAGRLVDTKGPGFTLNLGMGMLGVGCGIVAVMNSAWMFVVGFAGFAAIGFGIVATHVVATAVTRSFRRNTGLATGIATSGATGGQFLIVPLMAALLAFASWRWSFGALSVTGLALIPCIRMSLRKNAGRDAGDAAIPQGSMAADIVFILRQPAFHVLFWSFLVCGVTTTGVIETHLLPFAAFCGFPPLPSATAYGLLSLVNLVGMIGAGWLTDRINRPLLLAAIYFLRAMTFVILLNLPGAPVEMLFVFAALFGAVDYATVPVTASLAASHVGVRVMGLTMGMISAGHAIGGAIGAYAGGFIFDLTGGYDLLWMSSLWLAAGAGMLSVLVKSNAPAANPAS